MMTVQECIQYVESHLEIRPATNNGAYTSGRTIKPISWGRAAPEAWG